MQDQNPTIALVHGAFAESASWDAVIERLQHEGLAAVAIANPLRSLPGDAAYVRDVVAALDGPVVLVGHSYGGSVITEAAGGLDNVVGLIYVAAFAPEHGESASQLSTMFPGSTLGDTLTAYSVATGGNEFAIRSNEFQQQFAADVPDGRAALMAATQRPITEDALSGGLRSDVPAWMSIPSWFVYGDQDRNIPVELHRFLAVRSGSRDTTEVAGASHAISVSAPDAVVSTILSAVNALTREVASTV